MKTRIPTPRRGSPLALASVALCLSLPAAASAEDIDGDGIEDRYDNCSEVADPTLLDADGDGYGNACDFDTNNDGAVGIDDLGDLFGALGTAEALYDFNGDGAVGNDDLGDFLLQLGTLPGPSGLSCAGTIPCIAGDPTAQDTDSDGFVDIFDNCVTVYNPEQMDADSDGYGTACDFDTNNDGAVGSDDLGDLFGALGTTETLYDFNGDGAVGTDDLADGLQQLGALAGPSGLTCAGTIPCIGGDPHRCDPWDPDSSLIADDVDCDGFVNEEDCDDDDPTQNHCLVDVSAGADGVCGLRDDGTILCFDDDEDYPPPSGSFVQVDVGSGVSCALRPDGTATCWGLYVDGLSWFNPSSTWIDAAEQTFVSLDTGLNYACGIRTDGQLACWGRVEDTRFGDIRAVPPGSFQSVAAAQTWACALNTAGRVSCWGDDNPGFDPPSGTFVSISAEGKQACGVRTSGEITCWGDVGATSSVLMDDTDYTSVSVQSHIYSNVCGLTSSGAVHCSYGSHWGAGSRGRPDSAFEAVSLGERQTCGIRLDGKVVCWGKPLPARAVEQVYALGNLTCHLDEHGSSSCFGDSRALPGILGSIGAVSGDSWQSLALSQEQVCGMSPGSLQSCNDGLNATGDPIGISSAAFASIHGGSEDEVCGHRWNGEIECWSIWSSTWAVPAGPFAQLDVGRDHACAVRDDGSVACWGDDSEGEATPPPGSFVSVSAGTDGTCGLQLDGTAVCWGDVEGDAPPTYFETVEAGAGWACGIRPDGTVQCWGDNADGQAEPPGDAFVSLTTGDAHTCGVLRAGGFVCWGDDSDGQLAP